MASTCGSRARQVGQSAGSSTSSGSAATKALAARSRARSTSSGERCGSPALRETAWTRPCTDSVPVSRCTLIMLCAASRPTALRTVSLSPKPSSRERGMPSGAYQARRSRIATAVGSGARRSRVMCQTRATVRSGSRPSAVVAYTWPGTSASSSRYSWALVPLASQYAAAWWTASGRQPSSAQISATPSPASGQISRNRSTASSWSSTSTGRGSATPRQPVALLVVIRKRPCAPARAIRGEMSAGSETSSRTSSQLSWEASHCRAQVLSCSCEKTVARAGCSSAASDASPASMAAGLSAVIHHTRSHVTHSATQWAASVDLPMPPSPCSACAKGPSPDANASLRRRSSRPRPLNNTPGRSKTFVRRGGQSTEAACGWMGGARKLAVPMYCVPIAPGAVTAVPMSPPAATDPSPEAVTAGRRSNTPLIRHMMAPDGHDRQASAHI